MKGVYSNFQVLFLGLIGLIMVGGSHFGVENYEILDSTTPDTTPVELVELPNSPHSEEITTSFTTTPATKTKNTTKQTQNTVKSTPVYQRSTTTIQTQTATATPNSITIGGRTIQIKYVSDTTVNASNMVAKYGNKFLYGHNTSNVFGHLANLSIGATFTVTLGGQTTTYQIAKAITLEKNTGVAPIMYNIAQAQYRGQTYNLALMTCAGTSYGNGDASHRLVIFANQV